MQDDESDAKVRPFVRYPAEWLRDPDFWRDVSSRALATAVVALLGYLVALLGGYISRPSGARLTFGLLSIAASIGSAYGLTSIAANETARGRGASAKATVAAVAGLVTSLGFLVLAIVAFRS